ncbi:MAG: alpha/beta fold hydrolase [Sciscionella sp.]
MTTATHSAEHTAAVRGGVSLCYDTFGDPADPTMLLVMGLGGPLNWWHPRFCETLATRGFHVVRFDNRGIGRSTEPPHSPMSRRDVLQALVAGRHYHPPYTMSDLADDALGVLDLLGVRRAHLVGISLGGMVAQTIAVEHPDRVQSLVSLMASTGRRTVGWQSLRIFPALLSPPAASREEYVERSMRTSRLIGSPAYPPAPAELREQAADTYDRGVPEQAVLHQVLAYLTQPDRTNALHRVSAPTLVLHGLADPMVHVSGGRATAQAIPGAELVLVPGMGHDLPQQLWPLFVDALAGTAQRAR